MRTFIALLLLTALSGSLPCFAADGVGEVQETVSEQRSVQRKVDARPGAFVSLRNLIGRLEVEGWERDEVAVVGTLGPGVQELRLDSDGQRVWLEVQLVGEPGQQWGVAQLRVKVPVRSHLEVRTVEAFAVLRGIQGRVDFESVSGGLQVEAGRPEEIIATTVSGDLVILAPTLRLQARSVGGAVRIEGEVEDLEVRTVDGPVELLSRVVGEARLESVSGQIHVMAPLAAPGRLRVFVHEGRAELVLPSDLAATFFLQTSRGTLESEFGPPLPAPREDARQEMRFRTGSGQARVEARSISGSLRLLKHRF